MKLSEFISSTLSEIVDGIELANEQLSDKGIRVNPPNIYLEDSPNKQVYGVWNKDSFQMHPLVEIVEFDVTLTAEETSNSGGKAGISIGVAQGLCCVIRFRSRVALLRLIVSQYGKF